MSPLLWRPYVKRRISMPIDHHLFSRKLKIIDLFKQREFSFR
jgi:hypothetical protein